MRKPVTRKRTAIPASTQRLVLHESGYKCANPVCRNILTLDIHHLVYVSEGGGNEPENLLPLCGHCHDLHHRGHIPADSLRSWKVLLLGLNEAFDRKTVDILLALDKQKIFWRLSGDALVSLAPLIAAGLAEIREYYVGQPGNYSEMYRADLSSKGHQFVDAWKAGDQKKAVSYVPSIA